MASDRPLLRVSNVSKSFGANLVLDNISVSLAAGEVLSVIGPSGSGKSTLLRCIAQLESTDSGLIELDGEVLGYVLDRGMLAAAPKRVIRAQQAETGVVFQHFNLFPHRTVLENLVEAPTRVKHLSRATATATALELLDRVGLSDKAKRYPEELSGGQRQRVAIARALAMKPRLLLFDEPTSALDPELVGEVLDVIKDLAHTGTTLVVVTHEINLAREISDHVLVLDKGRIVEYGTASVIDNPQNARTQDFLARITAH